MRWLRIPSVALLVVTNSVAAQTPSRLTLSAGPEWTGAPRLWGLRLYADYDLLKLDSPFQLRLQGGGRWGPPQRYTRYFGNGAAMGGEDQTIDLTAGVVGALSPIPRARVAPYVMFGVLAQHVWAHGWMSARNPDGSLMSTGAATFSYGKIVYPIGLGVRAQVAGRSLQVEIRRLNTVNSLTLGTRLPF